MGMKGIIALLVVALLGILFIGVPVIVAIVLLANREQQHVPTPESIIRIVLIALMILVGLVLFTCCSGFYLWRESLI